MRVLLATDGSADARRATRWLRDVALPADTAVCALSVAMLTAPPSEFHSMTDLRTRVRAQASDAARRAAESLKPRWPGVETAVIDGDPRVEIVDAAERTRTDMIVLGARGLSPFKRLLAGSTSRSVARYAPCPVVIVRGRPRPLRRVLVAVDGSESVRVALRFLSTFGVLGDAAATLLHVVPEPARSHGRRSSAEGTDARPDGGRRTLRENAEEMLGDAVKILVTHRSPVERLVVEGDAATEIVRIARTQDVDLVVLGARGLGTIARLLLGSVSETVLDHAGRAVMIVRQR